MCHHLHNINNFYKNNNAKNLNEEKNKENKNADRYNIISLLFQMNQQTFLVKLYTMINRKTSGGINTIRSPDR